MAINGLSDLVASNKTVVKQSCKVPADCQEAFTKNHHILPCTHFSRYSTFEKGSIVAGNMEETFSLIDTGRYVVRKTKTEENELRCNGKISKLKCYP